MQNLSINKQMNWTAEGVDDPEDINERTSLPTSSPPWDTSKERVFFVHKWLFMRYINKQ